LEVDVYKLYYINQLNGEKKSSSYHQFYSCLLSRIVDDKNIELLIKFSTNES